MVGNSFFWVQNVSSSPDYITFFFMNYSKKWASKLFLFEESLMVYCSFTDFINNRSQGKYHDLRHWNLLDLFHLMCLVNRISQLCFEIEKIKKSYFPPAEHSSTSSCKLISDQQKTKRVVIHTFYLHFKSYTRYSIRSSIPNPLAPWLLRGMNLHYKQLQYHNTGKRPVLQEAKCESRLLM